MDDLISRQAAIKAFYIQSDDDGWWVGTAQDAETLLNGLPTAERVGKWIEVKNKWGGLVIICSECGAQVPRDGWGNAMQSAYCPNCGTRMAEGGDAE